jgi:hypothetical protein
MKGQWFDPTLGVTNPPPGRGKKEQLSGIPGQTRERRSRKHQHFMTTTVWLIKLNRLIVC